ncbi:MAG: glycoside hydrolase family 19 protein [Gallionellaceae bacterium]|nr:glycoside hydrolase family 19 protein [Gallionellaceae bacterium]
MRVLTARHLAAAINCPEARAAWWADSLNEAMRKFEINTPTRQAAFLAQVSHESMRLMRIVENLNYSAIGLLGTFEKYFTEAEAERYARQPQAIANRVYASRMGNGDEASGDGWKYRGRGLIQITGKNNYQACGDALGIDLVADPDMLTQHDPAALSAAWYWKSHGCNELADLGDFHGITRRINGGDNGAAERFAQFELARYALA